MLRYRLEELREKKGMTRKEMAKYLEIDQSTYGKYELGKREPDIETIEALADYFNVSVDYLLGRTDELSPYPRVDTIAAHRTDDPMSELPEEARKSVEEFIDYVYKKYKNTNKTTP
jgi:transcriptional regulator with XRE-family HTH domain